MRFLLVPAATALLGGCAGGCAGVGKTVDHDSNTASATGARQSASTTVASAQRPTRFGRDSDKDYDNPGSSYYDKDDAEILAYGKAASQRERQQVTALVKRYYATAAAGDGATGCSLVYSLIDESTVEGQGQATPRNETCAAAMAKLFKQDHAQLAAGLARLRVTGVRVGGSRGYALLGGGRRSERYLLVHRESGAWKIEALVDSGMP